MRTVSIGGHRYSDPDVLSLIEATGSLVDPCSAVTHQARKLLKLCQQFQGVPKDPIERLKILASLVGIKIEPMDIERQRSEKRDALLYNTDAGRVVLYNPRRPRSRVAFSIAHEIAHTFFPNSIKGTRFRSLCDDTSREANELERLCDLGASELLLPVDEFRQAAGKRFGLDIVECLCDTFGSSYEATVFRLASAHQGTAIAGLLKFRLTVGEERNLQQADQQHLFAEHEIPRPKEPIKKYRRQSLHLSQACTAQHIVRWNKSFDQSSIVYAAGRNGGIHSAREPLPNSDGAIGTLEAIRAPYQREDADEDFADVLFFWQAD
jgi:Zn-dependent peptidase ImmA (M78 family)